MKKTFDLVSGTRKSKFRIDIDHKTPGNLYFLSRNFHASVTPEQAISIANHIADLLEMNRSDNVA
ncbi:hypothetical protein [Corynebacterium hansenii]|nr:hypothetical protein [Corynebacterium hansenii]